MFSEFYPLDQGAIPTMPRVFAKIVARSFLHIEAGKFSFSFWGQRIARKNHLSLVTPGTVVGCLQLLVWSQVKKFLW